MSGFDLDLVALLFSCAPGLILAFNYQCFYTKRPGPPSLHVLPTIEIKSTSNIYSRVLTYTCLYYSIEKDFWIDYFCAQDLRNSAIMLAIKLLYSY